ncbi:MAG: DUF4197 domain-containing protein [Gammaproteobacteria bacterium]|nr:DUF4197 domain-containing protein [Gammaproteobacteria bacterium]
MRSSEPVRALVPVAALLALLIPVTPSAQGWGELGERFLEGLSGGDGREPASTPLARQEIVAGLREALLRGSEVVVAELGRENGFLGRPDVRIPLPSTLETVGRGMRRFGLGHHVDAFETSLNRAAESAVPEALALLRDAVRGMSFAEARRILEGPDDAATTYFRERSETRLVDRFLPIVRETTAQVGVTAAYKRMLAEAGMLAQFLDPGAVDLDRYVTDEAIDGLFLLLAREEKRIREEPVARTSELLRRVFGSR